MTKDILDKAKELERDIESLRILIKEKESGDGLCVSSSFPYNYGQSVRFQKELCDWMKQKKSVSVTDNINVLVGHVLPFRTVE